MSNAHLHIHARKQITRVLGLLLALRGVSCFQLVYITQNQADTPKRKNAGLHPYIHSPYSIVHIPEPKKRKKEKTK